MNRGHDFRIRIRGLLAMLLLTAASALAVERPPVAVPVPAHPRERHLANLRQLTFGGENAEAYFSFDGRWLVFQSTRDGYPCDQIYVMRTDGTEVRRVSTGLGRTTCAYLYPGGREFLYASTHHVSGGCPPTPDHSKGYVWPLYAYDIFLDELARPGQPRRLTHEPGYDAEAVLSPDGLSVVFTSDRDGDLELYTMRPDGSRQRRLTRTQGYDGGAFFSPDSKRIVYRAHHPEGQALAEYDALLAQRLVRPTRMEIRVIDADGKNDRQVTRNGKANFAPYFHPDGKRILFSSNMLDPKGRNFDLFMVGDDGRGLERVTWDPTFDAFPMFSPDGKQLVFASNRSQSRPGAPRGHAARHDTNIFIADWRE